MELEKQREWEEMEEEEKNRPEAPGNVRRGGWTKVTVEVEIPRRRETRVRPVSREGEDTDLRMEDSEVKL